MGKLLLDNIAGIAGETIKLLILIVTGVVLLDRVKNATRELITRVAALEHWRDEPISSSQPHTVCVLEDRRKIDEREWLERIEQKIDRLARISHRLSTAAADPGMSTALRSLGLLDVLSSTPAGPSVARLVSMPVCAASLRNPVRNAGWKSALTYVGSSTERLCRMFAA